MSHKYPEVAAVMSTVNQVLNPKDTDMYACLKILICMHDACRYDKFAVDVTDVVASNPHGPHELVVEVYDPTGEG